MTTTHTPGPWVATVDADGDNLHVESAGNVYVVGGCGCCGSPYTDKNCAEANARLIAAAPELLEALEDLCSFDTPLTQDKWDKARDVIAKAKGEA